MDCYKLLVVVLLLATCVASIPIFSDYAAVAASSGVLTSDIVPDQDLMFMSESDQNEVDDGAGNSASQDHDMVHEITWTTTTTVKPEGTQGFKDPASTTTEGANANEPTEHKEQEEVVSQSSNNDPVLNKDSIADDDDGSKRGDAHVNVPVAIEDGQANADVQDRDEGAGSNPENVNVPVVSEDGNVAVVKEDGSAPVVKEDEDASVVSEDGNVPVVKEDENAPVVKEDSVDDDSTEEDDQPVHTEIVVQVATVEATADNPVDDTDDLPVMVVEYMIHDEQGIAYIGFTDQKSDHEDADDTEAPIEKDTQMTGYPVNGAEDAQDNHNIMLVEYVVQDGGAYIAFIDSIDDLPETTDTKRVKRLVAPVVPVARYPYYPYYPYPLMGLGLGLGMGYYGGYYDGYYGGYGDYGYGDYGYGDYGYGDYYDY